MSYTKYVITKIDCLKQLLLQFIKLTDAHLLLKLNMRKNTRRKERGDRKRKERKEYREERGKRKERRKKQQ